MMIKIKHVKDNKSDGMLLFTTPTGRKGHIVLDMTDGATLDTEKNILSIDNFGHTPAEVIVAEITINITEWFTRLYELTFEPMGDNLIRICCNMIKD